MSAEGSPPPGVVATVGLHGDWLVAVGGRFLLSVRDPRDACMSMAQRFRAPLAHAVQ